MANNAANAVVANPVAGGGVLMAPRGTTLPTDVTTALNASFKALGYVTEDGLSETTDRDTDTVAAWGGDTIATTQKSYGKSFKFTLAEYLNADVQKLLKGDANVTTVAANTSHGNQLTAKDTADPLAKRAFVFDMVAGIARARKVAPIAQVSDLGDIDYKSDDVSGAEVTLTCYPDANGVYVYTYTDDGVVTTT